MNRIILIGNGFDLAHGLKTSYQDFIDWFWEKSINSFKIDCLKEKFIQINNENLSIHASFNSIPAESYTKETKRDIRLSVKEMGSEFYNKIKKVIDKNITLQNWVDIEKKETIREKEILINSTSRNYLTLRNSDHILMASYVNVECKNIFLKIISDNLSLQNWVDIEEEYYKLLQEIMNKKKSNDKKTYDNIKQLNNDFSRIKEELENYLTEETRKGIGGNAIEFINTTISNNIYSNFESRDLIEQANTPRPKSLLFLSFNYSNTEELYFKLENELPYRHERETIHIHGELKKTENPIIFGYGDEIGKEYEEIENLVDNDFLENIKSIRYSDTSNYKRLLDYINSDKYQIFLFGHSCGLSDRTLLNTLFEHKNCVSVKPFYHKKENGTDNYSDIVRNISRHFKDKAIMREKVVNKEYCKPLS